MRSSRSTVLILVLILMGASALPASERPNIIVIMADDMGFSDIGCYGSEIRTPNIDALAAGGLRFTQFYNTGRCCPTRAALLTGLYPHQAGVGHMTDDRGFDGYRGDLNESCVTVAQVLRSAGYSTYMAGKWHVTRHVGHWSGQPELTSKHNWPTNRGFDRFFGTITGAGSYFNPTTLVEDDEPAESPEGFYYTDAINDTASRYVREHKTEKPFFMYVAHVAPHWPLHAREEDIARNRGRYAQGWDALRAERHRRMVEMGIVDSRWTSAPRDDRTPSWDEVKNKGWHERRMEVYAAQIESMDRGIGRLIEALRETGRLENTLILFLADNGGCAEELSRAWTGLVFPKTTRDGRPTLIGNNPTVMPGPEVVHQSYGRPWAWASNTPFRLYKHYVHEGGIASPLIVHWPAAVKRGGELRSQPGHVIDLMATCLDVASANYPAEHDAKPITPIAGISLRPAFEGRDLDRRPLFWEHEGHRAMRDGNWKLVAIQPNGPWELYDLESDRTETRDLAAEQPEQVERMSGQWERWARSANVKPWPHKPPK